MARYSSAIIIPDQHAMPGDKHKRAVWLGKLIADRKPKLVVNLGDAWDMPSLCTYDRGTKGFEGRRYVDDVTAGIEFQDLIWKQVPKCDADGMRKVFLVGNHEHRIHRAANADPVLWDKLSLSDLQLDTWYDTVVDYQGASPGTITIDGITYGHFSVSGVMGRPIGGEHPAHSLLVKKHQSMTVGHLHLLNHAIQTREDGLQLHGLVAGCYDDDFHDYAGAANKMWWRGIVEKEDINKGQYDLATYNIKRLKREYK